jgi:hypothetical protein
MSCRSLCIGYLATQIKWTVELSRVARLSLGLSDQVYQRYYSQAGVHKGISYSATKIVYFGISYSEKADISVAAGPVGWVQRYR